MGRFLSAMKRWRHIRIFLADRGAPYPGRAVAVLASRRPSLTRFAGTGCRPKRFAPVPFLFRTRVAAEPPGLILTDAQAALQRAQNRRDQRLAWEATTILLARGRERRR